MKGKEKRGSQGDWGWEAKITWGIYNRLHGAKPEEICTWVSFYILSWVLTQDFAVLHPEWAKLGMQMAFLQEKIKELGCIWDKCISITLCSAQGRNAVCTCRTFISLLTTVTTALPQCLPPALLGGEINYFLVSSSAKKSTSDLSLPCTSCFRGGFLAKLC